MSDLLLTNVQIESCEDELRNVLNQTDAYYALLCNYRGLVVAQATKTNPYPPISINNFLHLSSPVLSSIASMSRGISKENGHFSIIVEDISFSYYMLPIHHQYIVQVLLPSKTKVGKVRYLVTQLQDSLRNTLKEETMSTNLSQTFNDAYFTMLDKQLQKHFKM